jgi:hypothetical protein
MNTDEQKAKTYEFRAFVWHLRVHTIFAFRSSVFICVHPGYKVEQAPKKNGSPKAAVSSVAVKPAISRSA